MVDFVMPEWDRLGGGYRTWLQWGRPHSDAATVNTGTLNYRINGA